MIDITKTKPSFQEKFSSINLILLLSLVWVVYDTSYWEKLIPDRIVPKENLSQVLFVVDDSVSVAQGQASLSVKIDNFCDNNNIEKRRLSAGQDVSGSEQWLQDMAELGYSQTPCIVFREQLGKLDAVPIPEGIDLTLQEIQRRL
tara:strand:- start:27742 stop:28176 length:435 start_codon:yes stop_codon:yes gene_type:complete